MSINWLILTIIISTFSAIAAMVTAIAAYRTINATKEAAELPILKDFLAQYSSEEMRWALDILTVFETNHEHAAETYFDLLTGRSKEENLEDLDKARRRVKFYFFSAYRLHRKRFISTNAYRAMTNVEGIRAFFGAVEPMEIARSRARGIKYEKNVFDSIAEKMDFVKVTRHTEGLELEG
jgi:hypothetical protein